MDEIRWNDTYLTGVGPIDLQHQCFVQLINDLATLAGRHAPPQVIDGKLRELRKYADYHFCSEELLMLEQDYPQREAHGRLHADLLSELDALVGRTRTQAGSADAIVRFLFLWFVSHTTDEDLQIGQWLRRNDASPATTAPHPSTTRIKAVIKRGANDFNNGVRANPFAAGSAEADWWHFGYDYARELDEAPPHSPVDGVQVSSGG